MYLDILDIYIEGIFINILKLFNVVILIVNDVLERGSILG